MKKEQTNNISSKAIYYRLNHLSYHNFSAMREKIKLYYSIFLLINKQIINKT